MASNLLNKALAVVAMTLGIYTLSSLCLRLPLIACTDLVNIGMIIIIALVIIGVSLLRHAVNEPSP